MAAAVGWFRRLQLVQVNIAWSFSRLAVHSEPLFSKISQRAEKEASTLDPENISQLLWAFANVDIKVSLLWLSACSKLFAAADR